MSETRIKVWLSKTSKVTSSTPNLCNLQQTTEIFKENVKRAHHQALIWQSVQTEYPDDLDITEYGWVKGYLQVILPYEVELAPNSILRLVKCGFQSSSPYNSCRVCIYCYKNTNCAIFCGCYNQGCSKSSS